MGDMLCMRNFSKIIKVHGSFVDDKEVEQITEYLKSTGVEEYISAVTRQLEEYDSNLEHFDRDESSDKALYKNALQIIQIERKVSISHAQ